MSPRRVQLLVALLAGATFVPILRNGFVNWDDPSTIQDNPRLRPPTWNGIAHYWQHSDAGLYIPVTYTGWAAISAVAYRHDVMHAAWFHLASLLLHGVNSALAAAILWSVLRGEWGAFVGAMVFAVHPAQVESVAWASGWKDVLAGTFTLLFIWQYLHWREQAHKGRHMFFMWLWLALGVLSKPIAIVAPAIAAVIELILLGGSGRRVIRTFLPFLLLIVPCIIWSRAVQPSWPQTQASLWTRPLVAADALAFYCMKLLWPQPLTPLYGRTPIHVVSSGIVYFTWVVPVVVSAVAIALRRRIPGIFAGWVAFVAALLPVLGLVSFSFQLYSTVADHYLYLPLLGVGLAAGGIARASSGRVTKALFAVVLALLSLRAILQQRLWRDSVTLFTHAVACDPANPQAHGSLASSLALAGRVAEAIPHFQFVEQSRPNNPQIHLALARAYAAVGRNAEALQEYDLAILLSGGDELIVGERAALRAKLDSPGARE